MCSVLYILMLWMECVTNLLCSSSNAMTEYCILTFFIWNATHLSSIKGQIYLLKPFSILLIRFPLTYDVYPISNVMFILFSSWRLTFNFSTSTPHVLCLCTRVYFFECLLWFLSMFVYLFFISCNTLNVSIWQIWNEIMQLLLLLLLFCQFDMLAHVFVHVGLGSW